MEPYVSNLCNCCGRPLTTADEVIICPACRRPHHVNCWVRMQGCSTDGCSEQNPQLRQQNRLAEQQRALEEREARLREQEERMRQPAEPAPQKKRSKAPVILLALLLLAGAAAALWFLVLGKKKVDFNSIYRDYCNSIWASVGSDGSYLSIDTNPFDVDDDGIAYPAAWEAVKRINAHLGLPGGLEERMSRTSALDGRQRETFEKQGVNISWKYHPDSGLEITYSRIE